MVDKQRVKCKSIDQQKIDDVDRKELELSVRWTVMEQERGVNSQGKMVLQQ